MAAKILRFPNWANLTDDDLTILLRASIKYLKVTRNNPSRADILSIKGE